MEARLAELNARVSPFAGSYSTLDQRASAELWQGVRDVRFFEDVPDALVWRLSVPPSAAVAVVEQLERTITGAKMFMDWGGGLIWVAVSWAESASLVRRALGDGGGHATLIRAPGQVRAAVDVFQPQSAALAALAKRVKAQFDPARVLNPGRMYADV